VRINPIVFGLAPMDRLHGERMAQDKGNTRLGAEIGQLVPGEEAFDANPQVRPVRGNRLEKGPRGCLHITMQQDLSILMQDADIHGPGLQVNATGALVLFGVESHEVSSS
jgi:hypothetical protein